MTIRRNIIKPPKPPKNPARLARLKEHLAKAETAHERWLRKAKRALSEISKHGRRVKYYQQLIKKEEAGP
jgi:hypothetical protein